MWKWPITTLQLKSKKESYLNENGKKEAYLDSER
jgi:hypothetical protein